MYRSICKLFSSKKRSNVNSNTNRKICKFPADETGETKRKSSSSLLSVKITNNDDDDTNNHDDDDDDDVISGHSARENEKTATKTSVDVHQSPLRQISKNNHHHHNNNNNNNNNNSDHDYSCDLRHQPVVDERVYKSNRNRIPSKGVANVDDVECAVSAHESAKTRAPPHSQLHKFILDDVAEFHQKFADLRTDVRILVSKNVIVYVLGTNHATSQCKEDVVAIINGVRPETVLVELCSLRACSCSRHRRNVFQSAPEFTFRHLRTAITQLGFLPAMIFFTDVFREHLVAENSLLHYGGEFIAAMAAAQSLKQCRVVLADRPIEVTVKRQASAMGNWRGLRVTLQVTIALMLKRRMKRLMLNANRLVFDDPKTYEVLVFERDLFLTYSIQQAARQHENLDSVCRMVAVIGQGHVQGVQTYWGKVASEYIPFIMSPQTILDQ